MTASERSAGEGGEPTDRGARATTERRAGVDDTRSARIERVGFESHGVACEADLYLPGDGEAPWPVVVMAHVFGAERDWGLAPFAARFARAGIAAFVFDYRHLGGSGGDPRRLVDPTRQLDDWAAAIDHVRSLDAADGERIALWGSSFSGGHVLQIASSEPDVRAVVAQVPFVDGRATVVHQTRDRSSLSKVHMAGFALADRALAVAGLGPLEVPFVSEPGGGGLVDSRGAASGFTALVPEGESLVNRTPARVVLDLPSFRLGARAEEIDVPVHVVVAEEDRLLPREPTERVLEDLDDPSVHRVPTGHFDVHRPPWFEPVVAEQVAFLTDVLDAYPSPGER